MISSFRKGAYLEAEVCVIWVRGSNCHARGWKMHVRVMGGSCLKQSRAPKVGLCSCAISDLWEETRRREVGKAVMTTPFCLPYLTDSLKPVELTGTQLADLPAITLKGQWVGQVRQSCGTAPLLSPTSLWPSVPLQVITVAFKQVMLGGSPGLPAAQPQPQP